jgi:hypothetical protein
MDPGQRRHARRQTLSLKRLSQGDPLSTLGWVAFFDILLKALNAVQVKYPFYIRHSGSMLLPQRATCYADDTHGIFPCREATDLSNCISSAFAGMFGIAFHPEKLRAITTAEDPGVMTLYDWNWTPIIKEFGDRTAFITSLGVSYNLPGCSDLHQLEHGTAPLSTLTVL